MERDQVARDQREPVTECKGKEARMTSQVESQLLHWVKARYTGRVSIDQLALVPTLRPT